VTTGTQPRPKRLDELVAPGWASLSANLLRGGGVLVGLLLLWLGFLTGGFFLLLTGVLATIALVGGWLLGGLVTREAWYERPNARLLSLTLVVAFPVALVLFAQVAGPALTPPPTTSACINNVLAQGQQDVRPLAVDPRLTSMQFTLHVTNISGGAVRWFVQDPTGQSRWSGRQQQPGDFASDPIPAVGGRWTVNVVSEADTVQFGLDWRAESPSATMPPENNSCGSVIAPA
jgi:hypothetical protein